MKRGQKRLLGMIALAVAVRIPFAIYMGDKAEPLPGIYDQVSYHALAQSLLSGRGYSFETDWYPFTPPHTPTAHWSFLYPLFLAAVYAVFGLHPLAARLIQGIVTGALSCWLVYRLGRRLFGEKVGLAAAFLSAVYIYFAYYDVSLMTQAFYIAGVLAMFNLVLRLADEMEKPQIRLWLLLGLVLVLATLLRQNILPWVPVLFAWLLWRAWLKGALWRVIFGLVVATFVLAICILPFTWRNYWVYKRFLLLNSNTGYAMYSAQHPYHGTHFVNYWAAPIPPELAGLNEAQLEPELFRRGLEFVRQDIKRYLLLSLSRVAVFFTFWPSGESSMISNFSRVFSFGLYLPFFIYGIVRGLRSRSNPGVGLVFLFGAVYSLMHILTWAAIRYRLPVDAAFMPFAALAMMDIMDRIRAYSDGRRAAREPLES